MQEIIKIIIPDIFEMCIRMRIYHTCNYWGMRASAGLMRMYELQKVVAALPVDDLGDASALHVQTPGRMRKSLN